MAGQNGQQSHSRDGSREGGGPTLLRRIMVLVCSLGVLAAVAGTVLALAAGHGFIVADLANNLLLQQALATLVLAAGAFALRRRRTALIALLALGVQGAMVAPAADLSGGAALAGSTSSDGLETGDMPRSFRLIAFNVLARNDRHQETIDYLRREAADIVVLSEVRPNWARSLEALRDVYPYRIDCAAERWCGLALLSRHPLSQARAGIADEGPTPVIDARVRVGEADLHVVGTHLTRGLSRHGLAVKEAQAAFLPSVLAGDGGPAVLVGDMNAATWSPVVRGLEQATGLAAAGGVSGTWPAFAPLPLRVPIDHVLAGRGIQVVDRSLGPAQGSDHLPVAVTLAFGPALAHDR